jgi:SNF2 family DNA or RNA helicase
LGNATGSKIRPARMKRAIVTPSLTIRPPTHIPEPAFGTVNDLTPFDNDVFHHPPTLNPELAKEAYRQAGLRLEYTEQALKTIRECRTVEFDYDHAGFVWVRPTNNGSLKDILDDQTLKTFVVWSPYYDAYRLRQAGSVLFAKEAFEKDGVTVHLRGFPTRRVAFQHIRSPRTVNVTLYPFQRKAVEFILRNDGRACIFDEMGLGKTITASAAMLGLVSLKKCSRALVVAPNAVTDQWREELVNKFNLNPTLVTSKWQLRERMSLYNASLIVMNYELLRTDLELILQKGFDTLILDEVTRVKNWDTQTSEAAKKLIVRNVIALTGTPLENHLGELYNIVNIVKPGFFGRYNEDFSAKYTIKIHGQGWGASRPIVNPETLPDLRKKLQLISLRRTKAQVLKQLPALTMQYVYTEPARNQKLIYDILQESLAETIIDEYAFSEEERGGHNPFTANRIRLYTLLREACADISMIAGYLRRKQRETTEDAVALRESPVFRKLVRVLTKLEPENAKMVELKELVKDLTEQGHKMVIFSQFVPIVNLVQDELANEGIGTLVYHGQLTNDDRIQHLKDFLTQPEYRVLASTDAGQFGLNLQVADVVVNYDLPWNPARLQQRVARLHRIGQTGKVLAINFIVKGTVEEHVRNVLESKRKLFRDVTVTEMADSEDLDLEELREIFGFDMRKLAEKIRELYGLRVESQMASREVPSARR